MVSCLNTNAKLQNFLLKSKVFPQKMLFFLREKAQKYTINSMLGIMLGLMLGLQNRPNIINVLIISVLVALC